MKAVIIFALFAFAVTAFDLGQYHAGFTQQLGLNTLQVQDGINCFTGVFASVQQLAQVAQGHASAEEVAMQVLQVIRQMKITVPAQCQPYVQDLVMYVAQHTDIQNLNQQVNEASQTYLPEILKELGQLIGHISSGDAFSAGESHASIIQILIGVTKPALPEDHSLNWDNYVNYDVTKFNNEYYQAIFDTLSIQHQFNATALTECLEAAYLLGYSFSAKEVSSFEQQLDIIDESVLATTRTLRTCKNAFRQAGYILAPIFRSASRQPVEFAAEVVFRVMMNLREIEQTKAQESTDIFEGRYAHAGEEAGKMINLILGGLVNFSQ